MKMRVIPTPIYIDFMNATGANAVPMPFTETYGALEQGALDGMTNPLLNILDGKYNEVTKHLTLTNHMYTPQIIIASKKTWDKLSPGEQKILKDAAQEAAVWQRQVARAEAAKVLDAAKKAGMTIHELPAAEVAGLREAAKPVIAKHAKTIGEDFVNEVNAELAKMRGAKK
jgi:TRAP-type C4-dicarboxylate transport system substrate-binding protein